MSLLPFFIFSLLVITSGTIVGAMAKRKHRNVWLWKAAGAFSFLVALLAIVCFKDLNSLTPEERKRSILREKIVFIMIVAMVVSALAVYFQAE